MFRLKIADADFESLRRLLLASHPMEAGAFALAGVHDRGPSKDVLVRRVLEVPTELLTVQLEHRLEVSSRAINGVAALCQANGLGLVVCHSHPKESPYSLSDDFGESRLFSALEPFIPPRAPMASLLFWPEGIVGRLWLRDEKRFLPLDEVYVIGRVIRRFPGTYRGPELVFEPETYDRQIRAFGTEGQARVAGSRVAVVGVGGTGSSAAEQVARLGVRDVVIIDHDVFSPSNVTRMYGTYGSRRRLVQCRLRPPSKVDLIASHMRRIQPGIRVTPVNSNVVLRGAAKYLMDRDIIFLCTDDHWGRAIVNELAYQYLIPAINVGSGIRSEGGSISGASGSVDIIRPGTACLWCGQFLSAARIAAEALPPSERIARHGEGYVEDVDSPTPSVVSINATLSGLSVTLFLQLVTDFAGPRGAVSRLRYDVLNSTVRRGTTSIQPGCVCQQRKGYGDLRPLSTVPSLPRTSHAPRDVRSRTPKS